jgi:hypothetical protein
MVGSIHAGVDHRKDIFARLSFSRKQQSRKPACRNLARMSRRFRRYPQSCDSKAFFGPSKQKNNYI